MSEPLGTPGRTARLLLSDFLTVRQPESRLALFADDAVYEVPYLESLGLPWRYRGRDEVGQLLRADHDLFPRLEVHDVVIVAEATARVIAEYRLAGRSTRTGRMIEQLVVGRLDSMDGRITLLRETVNLVEAALALYPQGLADYRVPSDRGPWLQP